LPWNEAKTSDESAEDLDNHRPPLTNEMPPAGTKSNNDLVFRMRRVFIRQQSIVQPINLCHSKRDASTINIR
jgi:hypothetical protein